MSKNCLKLFDTIECIMELDDKRKKWLLNHTCNHTLYHYTNKSGFEGILNSGAIQCTLINSLADQNEFIYAQNLIKNVIKNKLLNLNNCIVRDFLEEIISFVEIADQQRTHKIFIASFCENSNSKYLWKNYADNNMGICLGFDINDNTILLNEERKDFPLLLRKIIYDRIEQENIIRGYIDDVIMVLKIFTYRVDILHVIEVLVDIMFSLKDPLFKDEQEWRLVRSPAFSEVDDLIHTSKTGKKYIYSYILENTKEGNVFPLKEIIIGSDSASKKEDVIAFGIPRKCKVIVNQQNN